MIKNTVKFLSFLLVFIALFTSSLTAQTNENKVSKLKPQVQASPNSSLNNRNLPYGTCNQLQELPDGEVVWLACYLACKLAGHSTSFCVVSCTYVLTLSPDESPQFKSYGDNVVMKEINLERKHEIGVSVLLLEASMFGHTQTIKDMLEEGANVNVKVSDIYVEDEGIFNKNFAFRRLDNEDTPLLTAIKYGIGVDAIDVLLRNGADINVKTKDGKTPLILANEKGREDIVELLKKTGTN